MNKYWDNLRNDRYKTSLQSIKEKCEAIYDTLKIEPHDSNSQINLAKLAWPRKLSNKVTHYILWKIQNEWNGYEQESN